MKFFNKIITIFLLFAFVSINGCGLILSGNKDDLYVNSYPKGAEVYINGLYMGETPLPLVLKSDKDYIVEFRKDGYERKTKIVNSSPAAEYVILDIAFAFLPVIIDAATGGWNTLDDEYCYGILENTSDAEKRKKDQADIDKENRLNDIKIERNNLSSSDRDNIAAEVIVLQNKLKELEDKRDNALKENNYNIKMAKMIVDRGKYKNKARDTYIERALIANKKVNYINDYIFPLKEKLNRLYELIPDLKK